MVYKKRISVTLLTGLLIEILNKIAPLIIFHIAQKRLGTENLGFALFGISVIELVTPFIMYGYNQYGAITAGRDPQLISRLMSGITFLKFFHFLVLLSLLYFFFKYVPAYQDYFTLIMSLSFLLGCSILDFMWVQSATQELRITNIIIGVCRLITLMLILFFIKDSQDAILFAVLSLVGNALLNFFSMGYSLKKFSFQTPDWPLIKDIFIKSSPYSIIIILGIIGERMDIFFAEHFGGLVGAGYYACCARLGNSLTQIANTIINAFFSEMVSINDKESQVTHMKMSTWVLLFFLSPIIFGVWFVDGDILSFIFDESFRSIQSLLGFLFLSISFGLLASSFGQQILLINGQIKTYSFALFCGIVSACICVYFIGSLSLHAIAISMCVGKFISLVLVMRAVKRHLEIFPFSIIYKTMVPGVVMSSALYFLNYQNFFLNIFVGGLIFMVFGYLLNRKEFSFLFTHAYRWFTSK